MSYLEKLIKQSRKINSMQADIDAVNTALGDEIEAVDAIESFDKMMDEMDIITGAATDIMNTASDKVIEFHERDQAGIRKSELGIAVDVVNALTIYGVQMATEIAKTARLLSAYGYEPMLDDVAAQPEQAFGGPLPASGTLGQMAAAAVRGSRVLDLPGLDYMGDGQYVSQRPEPTPEGCDCPVCAIRRLIEAQRKAG